MNTKTQVLALFNNWGACTGGVIELNLGNSPTQTITVRNNYDQDAQVVITTSDLADIPILINSNLDVPANSEANFDAGADRVVITVALNNQFGGLDNPPAVTVVTP